MADLNDLQRKLDILAKKIPDIVLNVFATEGTNFINKNFREQGFTDESLKKWKPRKTTDRNGRDLTRYRTNRKGKQGRETVFGEKNKDRAILVSHNKAGDHLHTSFTVRRQKLAVIFSTYKKYAEFHNEGTDKLPQRQFLGKSKYLDKKISQKITKELDQIMK